MSGTYHYPSATVDNTAMERVEVVLLGVGEKRMEVN